MRNRLIGLGVALACACCAHATEDYLNAFLKKYSPPEGSALVKASCALCHVSDEDFEFNPYGQAVKALGKDPTEALFVEVESADSDKDGMSNGEEIKADRLPGKADGGGNTPAAPEAEKKEEGPIPKTGFHPAIVHFPIALFIAGLLLDFIGLIRRETRLLYAGWYNIVLAAITSLGAVASGFYAMSQMGFPLKGNMGNHVYYTVGATVAMWIMVALRVHRHEQMNLGMRVIYYILAVVTFLGLSWAGHLGGVVAGTA